MLHCFVLLCLRGQLELLQVRELTNDVAPEPFRWTAEGLLALQEVNILYLGLPEHLPISHAKVLTHHLYSRLKTVLGISEEDF